MKRFPHPIDEVNIGRRIETVLCAQLPTVARGRLMKWLRTGKVRLNGLRAKPQTRVAEGDVLELPWGIGRQSQVELEEQQHQPPRRRLPPLNIIYEDDDIIIADKPAHLASHPGVGHDDDSLSARLVAYLRAWDAQVGLRPGLAQRLDAGVTGLVPCGKHAQALRVLSGPPHGPALRKVYIGLVDGEVAASQGTLTWPLLSTDEPRGDRPKVVVDQEFGLPAHTDYRVVARMKGATLVRLTLKTGRTHQIRAHLRALGHPLLGDPRYGNAERNAYLHKSFGIDRPLLHAAKLTLAQPMTSAPLILRSPLPADLRRMLHAWHAQETVAEIPHKETPVAPLPQA